MKLQTKDFPFSGLLARYLIDEETGAVSLLLLPHTAKDTAFDKRRAFVGVPELVKIGMDAQAWQVGSLAHLALRHHAQGNGAGGTLKYGESTAQLRFAGQTVLGDGAVETVLDTQEGWRVLHTLRPCAQGRACEISTVFENCSPRAVTLEMLTSFSLDNLSPYAQADARGLRLHRFHGGWSMEGAHIADSIEALNLACPWTYAFPESERFGVLGTHPIGRYFPVCAVEDTAAGVFWGASLEVGASWQMELSRDSDCYSLSGGVADSEFGGWFCEVPAGGSYAAPTAYVSVGGTLDAVCDNLTAVYHAFADAQPACEQTLPVIFNEWCTTWGNPSHERMLALADRLAGTAVQYLVIDAGWTDVLPNSFGQGGNGDWNYARDRFPGGLLATSRALRERGFVTGVWFEFEVTTRGATVFGHAWDAMHLQRRGEVIVTGDGRSFWDFRKPEVQAYLREKVLDFLRENEIGYLKVDYNGSVGAGCDGAESPGRGLQEHMEAVLGFFDALRTELPQLVIENCASGGHRLVAPFFKRTAMSSFSDAHEGKEIPVIAARMHSLLLPRQSQIWAVLNSEHDARELCYRLSSGFLGRLCLSGAADALDDTQMALVRRALLLYERASQTIKYGATRLQGCVQENIRHPEGWQAAVRLADDGTTLLVVAHTFGNAPAALPAIALPEGAWTIDAPQDALNGALSCTLADGALYITGCTDFSATVVLLHRR